MWRIESGTEHVPPKRAVLRILLLRFVLQGNPKLFGLNAKILKKALVEVLDKVILEHTVDIAFLMGEDLPLEEGLLRDQGLVDLVVDDVE